MTRSRCAERQSIRLNFRHLRVLLMSLVIGTSFIVCDESHADQTDLTALSGTELLTESRPLDVVMVEGIDRFALNEIQRASQNRVQRWDSEVLKAENQRLAFENKRAEFSKIIGCIDARVDAEGIELLATVDHPSLVASNNVFKIFRARWPALDGIDAEGYFLQPAGPAVARIIAIPDADWTPEQICGLTDDPFHYAADLAASGCEVLVPTLVSRDHQFSSNPSINRSTNLSHREFIYRQAFELGRHVIGYEVQKVLAAVDQFELRNHQHGDLPIGVCGVSEGGLIGFYSAAIDTRINGALISGYFNQRDSIWQEPIYRNVWGLLESFGDAQIASMIAPRHLTIEVNPQIPIPESHAQHGRNIAAPGTITRPNPERVQSELELARQAWQHVQPLDENASGELVATTAECLVEEEAISPSAVIDFLKYLTKSDELPTEIPSYNLSPIASSDLMSERQARTVSQMTQFTQRQLQLSHRIRDANWKPLDRTSITAWNKSADRMREMIHDELIGRLPDPTIPMHPRTRRIINQDEYEGYEVVLDVYPDVIASGILLLPKHIQTDTKRPVVVCQHGLEGTPMDTIVNDGSRAYQAYKAFSEQLVKQGYIVYAPQNPYRGQDAFRTLQRKSNPLARSLFSYIIPQHLVTLRWLATLPQVDRDRIGFYGLSYGGKTAVRVPPLLPPSGKDPGYALSICSADFNEWVSKNASTDAPFSYVWTPEYEIFEWNMGNLANYAELSMLMAPRPFMVERGHDDGVGIDEWVAWEFAKVRRHYAKLGLTANTEIEFFDGPHTINGKGTFDFLQRHLKLPTSQVPTPK